MKLKLILCLLGIFSLMEVNAHLVVNKNEVQQMSPIQLTGNDVPFEAAIGEVEITLSQNGVVVYSSSENIQSSVQKGIQLEFGSSGNFLIEIEGKNGAYACGEFAQ